MKKDKVLHVLAGVVVGIVAAVVWSMLVPHGLAVFGVAAAGAAGAAKELYDKKDYGVFDGVDLAATSLGGVIGVVAISPLM